AWSAGVPKCLRRSNRIRINAPTTAMTAIASATIGRTWVTLPEPTTFGRLMGPHAQGLSTNRNRRPRRPPCRRTGELVSGHGGRDRRAERRRARATPTRKTSPARPGPQGHARARRPVARRPVARRPVARRPSRSLRGRDEPTALEAEHVRLRATVAGGEPHPHRLLLVLDQPQLADAGRSLGPSRAPDPLADGRVRGRLPPLTRHQEGA